MSAPLAEVSIEKPSETRNRSGPLSDGFEEDKMEQRTGRNGAKDQAGRRTGREIDGKRGREDMAEREDGKQTGRYDVKRRREEDGMKRERPILEAERREMIGFKSLLCCV